MKKTILFAATVALTTLSLQAQNFQSVFAVGGTGDEYSEAMALDNAGNTIVGGNFQYTVDFQPGAGTVNMTEAGNSGNSDAYLASYTPSGTLNWAYQFGNTYGELLTAISVDAVTGNIYAVGYFSDTMDVNPGPGVTNLISAGYTDWFIVKFNSAGVFQWGTSFGSVDSDYATCIKIKGNALYVGGSQMMSSISQAYWLAIDPASGGIGFYGLCMGNDHAQVKQIDVDQYNNLYVLGTFRGTTDFDVYNTTVNRTSNGADDVFLCRYQTSPAYYLVFAQTFGGTTADLAYGMSLYSTHIYITGTFSGTIDADPNPGVSTLTGVGTANGFISKFNEYGSLLWTDALVTLGFTDEAIPTSIKVDATGLNFYLAGGYSGSFDLDPGAGTTNTTASGTNYDAFVAKYTTTGAYVSKNTIEGANTQQVITSIAVTANADVYAFGNFVGNMTNFDPTNTNTMLNSTGGQDFFVVKYSSCNTLNTSISNAICNGDTLAFGSSLLTTAGVYYDTLTSVAGCDSIVMLQLQVNTIYVQAFLVGLTMSTNTSGTYQWIDCATGQFIPFQTGASFTPTTDGSYAVIVYAVGCSDTSICFNITGTGIEDNTAATNVSVYPNPNNGEFTYLQNGTEAVEVLIYDALGQLVNSFAANPGVLLSLQLETAGMYTVTTVTTNGQRSSQRVVVAK